MPQVIGTIWHSPSVFEIRLARDRLDFKSGECVLLVDEDGCTSRPYSICSGTKEDHLAFVVRYIRGGTLCEFLASRQPGDEVRVGPPFGWFFPCRSGPAVLIATGTGVSPFLSYLKDPAYGLPLKLLYGVRHREDALYVDFLRQKTELLLAVSGEKADDGRMGRVTDFLDEVPLGAQTSYYLCGHGPMIRQTTAWLKKKGVDQRRVFTEIFFN